MEQSLYFEWVKKYFPSLVLSVVEKLNDSNRALTYLHRDILTPRFSMDGRWASITGNYTRVTADVVAMDSPLPLKKRDVVERATGYIPKLGMKMALNEKQMSDIDAMIAQRMPEENIVRAIFEDLPKCTEGVYEELERMLLQGLSTGVIQCTSTNNVGTAVRLNYEFKSANQKGVAVVWAGNASTSKPLDDVKRVMDKAEEDGNVITTVYADDQWIENFGLSEQVRGYYIFTLNGTNVASNSTIPVLDRDQVAQILQRRWGIRLVRVNRSCRSEINGVQTSAKPWKQGSATFVCDDKVGDLVWTNLAEMTRPVNGVTYTTANNYILLSKYRKNDPLQEFTTSQARVIPVISNVDRIYTLDSTTVQA